jgi:IS30 family transposase
MIKNLLEDYLSPEQISGRLMLEKEIAISHETIYRYVWDDKSRGGILYKSLRTQGKRYRSRGNNKDSRGRIKNAVSIDERPKVVDEKSRIGDWEIDTVIGKNHKQAFVTIVERKSKFTVMKKVENRTGQLSWWQQPRLTCYALTRITCSPSRQITEKSLRTMRRWLKR